MFWCAQHNSLCAERLNHQLCKIWMKKKTSENIRSLKAVIATNRLMLCRERMGEGRGKRRRNKDRQEGREEEDGRWTWGRWREAKRTAKHQLHLGLAVERTNFSSPFVLRCQASRGMCSGRCDVLWCAPPERHIRWSGASRRGNTASRGEWTRTQQPEMRSNRVILYLYYPVLVLVYVRQNWKEPS